MTIFFFGSVVSALLGWLMGFLSLFLIMLILIQRGKGGGLTGALGGPGGQSAFGSKAGDTFTVITIVIASVWGFSCAFAMWKLGAHTPAVALNETNIKAGPADKENEANPIVIPSADSAFGGLESDTEGIGSLTPPTNLIPAESEQPKPDADKPQPDSDKPQPDSDKPQPDSDKPQPDKAGSSDTPEAESTADPELSTTDGESESVKKDARETADPSDAGPEGKSSDEVSDAAANDESTDK